MSGFLSKGLGSPENGSFFFFLAFIYLYSGAIAIGVIQMVLHELPILRAGAVTNANKEATYHKGGLHSKGGPNSLIT